MAVAEVAASGGLTTRVVVGVALAVVAIAAIWVGGFAFTALVAAAALLMSAEWSVLHRVPRGFRLTSLAMLGFVGAIALGQSTGSALIVLAAGAGLLGLLMRGFDRGRAFWVALGLFYCGLPLIVLLWLRPQTEGLVVVAWLLAVVAATDIAAFFVGRAIGGRRLAPAISPNKTVAGLLGGIAAAAVVGALVPAVLDAECALGSKPLITALLGGVAACLAQGGDLFESWLKRRAGVKDSGTLLPGHGGVLDRLDGLVPVTIVAGALIAVMPLGSWA